MPKRSFRRNDNEHRVRQREEREAERRAARQAKLTRKPVEVPEPVEKAPSAGEETPTSS